MMSEVWAKWENRVVNGVFPLRRFIGRSNHSVVFLTEYKAQNLADAAIKLVPSDPATDDTQIGYWRAAAELSHPHLIKLLDTGRCRLGGHPFLFVVMEYAEETLSQILPKRPLTPDEVREMLRPTLETLAFLHGKDLVHGQLKPPNFLVIGDQLKLSSDNIHPTGTMRPSIAKRSVYDPPEAKHSGITAAADVWGLAVTMVEALTQRLPAELDQRTEFAALPPPAIPEGFEGIVERCLNRDPAERLTLGDLKAQLDPPPRPPEARPNPAEAAVSAPETAVSEHSADAVSNSAVAEPVAAGPKHFEPRAPQQETLTELLVRAPGLPAQPSPIRRLAVLGLAITLAVVIAVWAAWHQRAASEGSPIRAQNLQPVSSPAPLAAPQDAPPPAPMAPAVAPPAAPAVDAAVRHEEIPVVSRHARQSIRGDIVVTVRVTVDHSGTVVNQVVENRGSSKYFARLASKAAKKWRFAAAQNSREWLLEFDFTRDGTTGHAVPQS